MSTKIAQKHPVKGTREFELVNDTIEYRVKSVFGDEELTVVLSVLDPKPVTKGSMLHFVSEVNREPLVKMFVDKPDAATFNAFVETLINRIKEEDFGRLAASNRESAIPPAQLDTTIQMLETYVDASGISGLLDALRDLREAGGQVLRLALVPLGHALARLPIGNTGRARVSALAPMAPQPHIKRLIDGAMAAARLQTAPFLPKTGDSA